MKNKMGQLIKIIPSCKPVYLFQVIIYFAIVTFILSFILKNGYTMENNPDKFALWAGMWVFGFFGTLQFVVMLLTKVEVYENGIVLKKGGIKTYLLFDSITRSNWGKVKYIFITVTNYIDFYYINQKGKNKSIRLQSSEISKKAMKNLTKDYKNLIKFNKNEAGSTQIYTGY